MFLLLGPVYLFMNIFDNININMYSSVLTISLKMAVMG